MLNLIMVEELATPNILNRLNAHGITVLHICAGNLCRYDHVIALVNAGADVNQLSDTQHSILDIIITYFANQTSEWAALLLESDNADSKVRLRSY